MAKLELGWLHLPSLTEQARRRGGAWIESTSAGEDVMKAEWRKPRQSAGIAPDQVSESAQKAGGQGSGDDDALAVLGDFSGFEQFLEALVGFVIG